MEGRRGRGGGGWGGCADQWWWVDRYRCDFERSENVEFSEGGDDEGGLFQYSFPVGGFCREGRKVDSDLLGVLDCKIWRR